MATNRERGIPPGPLVSGSLEPFRRVAIEEARASLREPGHRSSVQNFIQFARKEIKTVGSLTQAFHHEKRRRLIGGTLQANTGYSVSRSHADDATGIDDLKRWSKTRDPARRPHEWRLRSIVVHEPRNTGVIEASSE